MKFQKLGLFMAANFMNKVMFKMLYHHFTMQHRVDQLAHIYALVKYVKKIQLWVMLISTTSKHHISAIVLILLDFSRQWNTKCITVLIVVSIFAKDAPIIAMQTIILLFLSAKLDLNASAVKMALKANAVENLLVKQLVTSIFINA